MNAVIHTFLSPCTHESRMFKEVRSVVTSGLCHSVIIAGLWKGGLSEHENLQHFGKIWRVRVWSRVLPRFLLPQMLKYFEWCVRIVFKFWRQDIAIIHAHSLEALPVSVVLKMITGAKLVYDAHELETERFGLRGIRKKLCQLTERVFIGYADEVLVVSESIAEWYRRAYKRTDPVVVRNIPLLKGGDLKKADSPLRKKLRLSEEDTIFIYLGGLAQGRGIRRMIQAVEGARIKTHIVFMGEGVLSGEIRESQKKTQQIHIIPPVSPDEVLVYTAGADVGCCLIDDTYLSYRYSLPNKLFEYLKAGLPVIINDLPEQKKIIEEFNCGWMLSAGRDLSYYFSEELTSEEIKSKKEGVAEACRMLDWSQEEKRLISLYRSVLATEK